MEKSFDSRVDSRAVIEVFSLSKARFIFFSSEDCTQTQQNLISSLEENEETTAESQVI